jgi:hypothetical protein
MFLIPVLVAIFGRLTGSALVIVMSISLVGAVGMYSFEVIAMTVEGPTVYFRDAWNYLD